MTRAAQQFVCNPLMLSCVTATENNLNTTTSPPGLGWHQLGPVLHSSLLKPSLLYSDQMKRLKQVKSKEVPRSMVELYMCSGVKGYRCTGVQVLWCEGVQVYSTALHSGTG